MARDKITEYSSTASENTVVGDVNIAENSALPSDMNNAVREVLSHQKEAFGAGTPLYVDQTNNRVGVNKTPTVALDVNGALSVSGAFTSLGIDDNANATAITIDSSENVLVGKTANDIATVGHKLGGGGSYASFSRASNPALYVNRNSADGAVLGIQKDGADVGGIGTSGGATYYGGSASGLMFNGVNINPTNGTATRVDNANDIGASSYRFKDLYLSGGAFLGGTGTANKLSDVETGTWTPVIGGASSRGGTWSSAIGNYTKVGNKVTLQVDITGSGMYFTATSGYTSITGVPFYASHPSGSTNYAGSWCGNNVGASSGGATYLNATTVYLHSSNSGQSSSGVNGIGVTITYFTSA